MSNTLKARASAGRGNSRLPLWLAWTGATMLGNLVGMSVSTGVVGSLLAYVRARDCSQPTRRSR